MSESRHGLPLDAETDFELHVNGPRYTGRHRREGV